MSDINDGTVVIDRKKLNYLLDIHDDYSSMPIAEQLLSMLTTSSNEDNVLYPRDMINKDIKGDVRVDATELTALLNYNLKLENSVREKTRRIKELEDKLDNSNKYNRLLHDVKTTESKINDHKVEELKVRIYQSSIDNRLKKQIIEKI